jgi:CPA1 family monovalent cation:H+ antiporter
MCAVAVVAHAVVDGLPWAAAFALGAIVAPTDPLAATTIARRLGVPRRIVTVVEGESLVNDGTALVAYRAAVAAVGGSFSLWSAGLEFVLSAVGGVLVGLVVGWIVAEIRRRIDDIPVEITISLLSGYAAYIPAEKLHASGVLAVVAAGFWLGHHDADAGFATRLQGRQVWRSLDTLLEALVFAYMGLQCRFVFDDLGLTDGEWLRFALSALVVLLVVLLIRRSRS